MSGWFREVAWLGQAMAAADDAALRRIVALLDGLRERGEADRVLEPARKRLRLLRPPHPLGFARLLFLPFDGAIVPSAHWRRGEALLPRGALAALAGAVRARLGPAAAAIARACEGRTTAEAEAAGRIGALLWPLAAEALPEQPPPDWAATGIAPADYPAIADLCRPVWAQGPALWAAIAAAAEGPPEDLARAALAGLAPAGPKPFALGLAVLLARAVAPGRVALVAAGLDARFRGLAVQGLEAALDQPLPEFGQLDPGEAAEAAQDLARRLEDLDSCGLLDGEARQQLQAIRRSAGESCRACYLAALERHLTTPAAALAEAPEVPDEAVAAMEAEARRLRLLDAAGRRLGDAHAYDGALRGLTERLAALAGRAAQPAGLRPIDLARIAEILAGPEAAAAVLEGGRRAYGGLRA